MLVLFASAKSTASTWVTFEMNEAEIRRLQGDIKKLLVLTIDDRETRNLLPNWLQVGIVGHAPTPARAADAITAQIVALESGARPSTLFIGRERDLVAIRGALIPPMGTEPPRALVLHGFHGMGRRSLARQAVEQHLSLEAAPVVVLSESDSFDWLHLELVSRAREFNDQQELGRALDAFKAMADADKGRELAHLLAALGTGRAVPVVVDEAGMLMDDEGNWRPTMTSLLRTLSAEGRLQLALVMPRSPKDGYALPISGHSVNPIDQESTRLLLTQGLRLADLTAEPRDVAVLAPYVGGYPPAALLLVDAIREYGVNAVVADVAALKDLTGRIFTPLLEKLNLSVLERALLRLLAPFRELPIQLLTGLGLGDAQAIAQASKRLSDLHLVVPGEMGISLSPPLRQAVMQRYGDITEEESGRIAQALRSVYWKPDSNEVIPLPIVDAVSVALARAGDLAPELSRLGVYELPSTLMRIAKESYDGRNWDRALKYARKVLEHDERREDALIIAFKATVRLESWDSAEELLETITRRGLLTRHYLRGFMEWKKGNLELAVASFRAAIRAGDRSLAVRHQLAYCLFLLNRPNEARAVMDSMPVRATSRNRYFLDLLAKVLIRLKLLDEAKMVVEDMRRYGFDADYWHRHAHVLLIEGRVDEAIEAARRGIETGPARNEARSLLTEGLIAKGDLAEAENALDQVVVRSQRDRDLRERLLCKIHTRGGDYQKAEAHWRRIRNPDDPDARRVRLDLIDARLAHTKLPNPARVELEVEREKVRSGRDDLEDLPLHDLFDPD
jgi:thioredoxin-like negative regulator of GroEL